MHVSGPLSVPAGSSHWPRARRVVTGSLVAILAAFRHAPDERMASLIPYPAQVSPRDATFQVPDRPVIALSDPMRLELQSLAHRAADMLEDAFAIDPVISTEPASRGGADVALILADGDAEADSEAYGLDASARGIVLTAAGGAGLFYGLETLRQLMRPPDRSIPAVLIEDRPRFRYRGMHLDVGRHLFPVAFIKRYIDLLAAYKMNTFHWHLTEDQGWRIEIERYPRLTAIGAYRAETVLEKNLDPYVGDGTPYGGFYTQDAVREIVAYAAARYVTIVPEIEMPGHSTAAVAAYPELACTEGPFTVSTTWGVHEDIYCPTERTFTFLESVLTEVMALFPGPYIHIGGDEAPKRRWQESAVAQDVIRREGLSDEAELQSYFIRRIEAFVRQHGRRIIGWDEILEGGLAPDATVMSWRGTAGGIEAARQGHDVIMTPTSHVYFDYYQADSTFEPLAIGGYTPLEKVYTFEPVPAELTAEEAGHILGAQGNVWTEYLKTPEAVEYMVFPRMLALAEVVWSPRETGDWESFTRRLPAHLQRLDALGVHYRVPHVRGLEIDRLTLGDHIMLRLETLLPAAEIRYTTDGSDPGPWSMRYDGPVALPVPLEGLVVTARVFTSYGRSSPAAGARFTRTALKPAESLAAAELANGLRYRYHEVEVTTVEELRDRSASAEGVIDSISFPGNERVEHFGLSFTGFFRAPQDGIYAFTLRSDDGSTLRIGDTVVIDHDGLHGATERGGMIALAAGWHPMTLTYFQAGGGKALALQVERDVDGVLEPGRMTFAHRVAP